MAVKKNTEKRNKETKGGRKKAAAHAGRAPALHKGKLPFKLPFFQQYSVGWKNVNSLSFFLAALTDVLFFILFFGSVLAFGRFGSYFAGSVIPSSFVSPNPLQNAVGFSGNVQGFYAIIIVMAILLFVVEVLLFSVSRALIWSRMLGITVSRTYFVKFFTASLLWFAMLFVISAILFLPLVIAAMADKLDSISFYVYIFPVFFVVADYYSYLLMYLLARTQKTFSSIKNAVKLGTLNLNRLGPHAIAAVATVGIVALASRLLLLLPETILTPLSYVLFFGMFTWVKFYAADVFRNVLEDKV